MTSEPGAMARSSAVIRIGTRASTLAMAQTQIVASQLGAAIHGAEIRLVPVHTTGDKLKTASLAQIGGKGLFVRELEQALTDGRIDLAVHSMKDLPAVLSDAFRLAAVPEREDASDALVSRTGGGFDTLASGARVGTSSLRRRFEALRTHPTLAISALRGNVDTRLKLVAEGSLDAIIIALAGLKRLGRAEMVKPVRLSQREFVPAGGQAALAIEALATTLAPEIEAALAALDNRRARNEITAERAFLAEIGASCATPVGVRAVVSDDLLSLDAIVFSQDGVKSLADALEVPIAHDLSSTSAADAGRTLGQRMLSRGAGALISNG